MSGIQNKMRTDYERDGFVIPDLQLETDLLNDIKAAHSRLLERYPRFHDYCPSLLQYDLGFLNFARNPAILDLVEQIIGPDIILWNMSFFAKPAKVGSRTPWHQDGEYWPVRPLATCTVWIALDESTPENGCLQVISGSHRAKSLAAHRTNDGPNLALNQELLPNSFDESDAVNIELQAGQFSLHDVYLMHGSDPNSSDKPRRGMTLRFMPATSNYNREIEAEQLSRLSTPGPLFRPIFLMRGEDRSGNNFQVR